MSLTLAGYRRFGERTKINLDGKLIALVGPNEAGKTTILEALARMLDESPISQRERTRPSEPADTDVAIESLWLLEHDDLASVEVPHGSEQPRWLIVGHTMGGEAIGAKAGIAVFAISLALAAGYEVTGVKRRALNRCHRTSRLPPSGVRGMLAVGRFGWVNTSGCVASCWPSMIAMLVADSAKPLAMIALTCATTYGRLARRPDKTRQRIAVGYVTGAVLALAYAT